MSTAGKKDKKDPLADLTDDEASRFLECFKNDEFKSLFLDYAKELSDPANREKMEQELSMMEGKTVVTPVPGFVFKSQAAYKKGEDKGMARKLFINVTGSEKIDQAKEKGRNDAGVPTTGSRGAGGTFWSIPYSLTNVRDDVDKSGCGAYVVDICVNEPHTLSLCAADVRFKGLVMQTAVEAIEESRGFVVEREGMKVMRNMRFKGDKPSMITLNPDLPAAANSANSAESAESAESGKSGNSASSGDAGEELMKTLADLRELSIEQDKKLNAHHAQKGKEKKKKEVVESKKIEEVKGPKEPKHKVIHRYPFDLANHTHARNSSVSARPNELVVTISVPGVKSARDLDLDVSDQEISLSVITKDNKGDKEGEWTTFLPLNLRLPFTVDSDEGSAKFDPAKGDLTIELPVRSDPNIELALGGEGDGDASLSASNQESSSPVAAEKQEEKDNKEKEGKEQEKSNNNNDGEEDEDDSNVGQAKKHEEEEEKEEKEKRDDNNDDNDDDNDRNKDNSSAKTAEDEQAERLARAEERRRKEEARLERVRAAKEAREARIKRREETERLILEGKIKEASEKHREQGRERREATCTAQADAGIKGIDYLTAVSDFGCTMTDVNRCTMVSEIAVPEYTFRQEPGEIVVIVKASCVAEGADGNVKAAFQDDEFAITLGGIYHLHIRLAEEIFPDACYIDPSEHNTVITLVKKKYGERWPALTAIGLAKPKKGGDEGDDNDDDNDNVLDSKDDNDQDRGGSKAGIDEEGQSPKQEESPVTELTNSAMFELD